VEGFDFGAHAVRRQRVLDLSGDVAVDEAQAKRQKPDQNQSDETRSETDRRNDCIAAVKETPAPPSRRAGRRFAGRFFVIIHRH